MSWPPTASRSALQPTGRPRCNSPPGSRPPPPRADRPASCLHCRHSRPGREGAGRQACGRDLRRLGNLRSGRDVKPRPHHQCAQEPPPVGVQAARRGWVAAGAQDPPHSRLTDLVAEEGRAVPGRRTWGDETAVPGQQGPRGDQSRPPLRGRRQTSATGPVQPPAAVTPGASQRGSPHFRTLPSRAESAGCAPVGEHTQDRAT